MTISAEQYFSDFEAGVASLHELGERVEQVKALASRSGLTFYWRGQASTEWGVHSSLHRSLAQQWGISLEAVSERQVVAVEAALVEEAREWIRPSVGARLTTVDLLARLQHHGIPTRLVDFSRDPLVALFFACVESPSSDGRLVVAAARRQPTEAFRNSFAVPWAAALTTRPPSWSSALHALDDQDDFLRISRQSGVFIVGGTPSTTPQRRLRSTGENLLAGDVRRCMSLPLALHSWSQAEAALTGGKVRGRDPTVASALSLRVPSVAKPVLLAALQAQSYHYEHLFPDVQGLWDFGSTTRSLRA